MFASKGIILYYPDRNSQSSHGKTHSNIPFEMEMAMGIQRYPSKWRTFSINGCCSTISTISGRFLGLPTASNRVEVAERTPTLLRRWPAARIPPGVISDQQISKPGPENCVLEATGENRYTMDWSLSVGVSCIEFLNFVYNEYWYILCAVCVYNTYIYIYIDPIIFYLYIYLFIFLPVYQSIWIFIINIYCIPKCQGFIKTLKFSNLRAIDLQRDMHNCQKYRQLQTPWCLLQRLFPASTGESRVLTQFCSMRLCTILDKDTSGVDDPEIWTCRGKGTDAMMRHHAPVADTTASSSSPSSSSSSSSWDSTGRRDWSPGGLCRDLGGRAGGGLGKLVKSALQNWFLTVSVYISL